MLRVIATESHRIAELLVSILSLEAMESNHMATPYKKENTIVLHLKKSPSLEVVTWIASEYLPDRLYFPYLGYSIDMIHEVGDVIVPNVFLGYSEKIASTEIDKNNRDSFVEKKLFIENFHEQKDYYVEDFGLSLGGILTSSSPLKPNQDLHEKLMLAYEADVFVSEDVFSALEVLTSDEIPTMILAGVREGKIHAKYGEADGEVRTIQNILTTINLLEDGVEE